MKILIVPQHAKYIFIALICFLSLTKAVAQGCISSVNTLELDGTNGFLINGVDPGDFSGWSVRNLGDINNDGNNDIIIGAYWADPNGNDKYGEVYVLFGTNSGMPASFDLSSLNGVNGFKIDGIDSWSGRSVSTAGDINNDGIDDLMLNAIYTDSNGSNTGSVFVVYGSSTAFTAVFDLNTLDGTNGFVINGVDPGDLTGISLSNAGDVNNDTIDDIIIGAQYASPNAINEAGRSYVLFGQSLGFSAVFELSDLDGTNGFAINGINIDDESGSNVANSGDINGDGIDDLMVSASKASISVGAVYIIFGSNTPFSSLIELSSLNGTNGFVINGEGPSNFLGEAIGSIGDINNDGLEDIAVSARQASPARVYVIFGTTTPFSSSFDLTTLNGTNGFVIEGLSVLSINNAGDFNNDGINDFIMGVPFGVFSQRGGYVVFGNSGSWQAQVGISDLNHFRIIEDGIQENLGYDVDGISDFNGDGVSDIIIGAPAVFERDDINGLEGVSYVVYGGDYCAMPLTVGYPQAINETDTGFTLVANGPETGTIHYAIFPGNHSTPVSYNDILNGVGSVTNGNFLMSLANTDVSEIISSLSASTTYDIYLFLEDNAGNQGEIYPLDDVTTLAAACLYAIPCIEVDALIALYNATDGANWTNNTNWLSTNPVNTWFGVTVSGGHVTEIDFNFSGNNLNGALPIELGDLNFLEKFSIPSNPNLTGTIVTELFTNLSLNEIDLSSNDLSGSIPSNISNLTALQSLDLSNNDLSGSIPSGIYTLTNLLSLDISTNNISGPISSTIQNLTQLTSLSLGSNPIGGTIPVEIGDLINLTNLDIYNAGLTGSIPTEVGNLINLNFLQLSRNSLSGSIPASLGNLNQIINFYLNQNDLTGSIPPSLGNFTNVKLFLLGNNQLTGAIPSELGNLINVTSFYLYNNSLSGNIPSTLGGLTNVMQLYLSDNQLDGVIPASLGTLPNVNDIFFFNNNLSGAFPDFTQAPNLNYRILLENNAFQFGDFENEWNAYQIQLTTFKDSPQANVNLEETIIINTGSSITMTTTVSGSQNNYQWYFNGALITGATSSDLVLNPAQLTDAGDYHCIITSNIVTDLTLRRNDIHLIVLVLDTEAPVVTCPVNQVFPCNTTVIPDYTGMVTVTDNLDPNPVITQAPIAGSPFTAGMTITITATDVNNNSSNCSFLVNEIPDTEVPVVSCPANQTLTNGAIIPDYTAMVTVSDNCDTSPTIVQSPLPGSAFVDGMIISMTVTDISGNMANCSFLINEILDTEAPMLTCLADQVLPCNTTVIPDYTGMVTVTDNLDPNPVITQAPISGSPFTAGMTITITATDVNNNSSNCSFLVNEIPDTEAPLVSCPANQTLTNGAIIPDYTAMVTVSDNCDTSPNIVQSPLPGSAFVDGMIISMTVTDISGNMANCSFLINEVLDTEVPMITCSADQRVSCNTMTIIDYTLMVTVTDDLDANPVITQNPLAGADFTEGMVITMTATDSSGNNSECSFTLNMQAESVDTGNDENIIEGETVQLNAVASTQGTFVWFPSIGLSDPNVSNPMANPTETTAYNVVFTSSEGCVAENTLTVFVESTEDETKYGFSPDNDGINEFWEIVGIENYQNNKVLIYNRWGDLVFEIEGYNNTSKVFRGIANRKRNIGGDELPEGTYFFDIKIEGTHMLKKVKGFIVLKR